MFHIRPTLRNIRTLIFKITMASQRFYYSCKSKLHTTVKIAEVVITFAECKVIDLTDEYID
jgi:hypothetical protein